MTTPAVATIRERLTNLRAPKISPEDVARAAQALRVTDAHIRMIMQVESGPAGSFGPEGRPVILTEPHIFSRLTGRRFDTTHPSLSYRTWGKRPYPSTQAARYAVLVQMADLAFDEAFQSCSWGLFQIMGFHADALGYESGWAMAQAMATGEPAQLDALVRFIQVNRLDDELRACRAGNAVSCEPFAAGYNGRGFRANRYHTKLAAALAKHSGPR